MHRTKRIKNGSKSTPFHDFINLSHFSCHFSCHFCMLQSDVINEIIWDCAVCVAEPCFIYNEAICRYTYDVVILSFVIQTQNSFYCRDVMFIFWTRKKLYLESKFIHNSVTVLLLSLHTKYRLSIRIAQQKFENVITKIDRLKRLLVHTLQLDHLFDHKSRIDPLFKLDLLTLNALLLF